MRCELTCSGLVWYGTRPTDWECGRLRKEPRVRSWNVDDLERCVEYVLGCGRYPVCRLGLWMAWKGISCTYWDCGEFGKVPILWFSWWLLASLEVRVWTRDGSAWYPVYGLRLWIVWKGTSCTDSDGGWIRKVPRVRTVFVVSSCSNQLRTGYYESTPRIICATMCLIWNNLLTN
jgi:hypothetical protein